MTFHQALDDHLASFRDLANISDVIIQTAHLLTAALQKGGKILICGNGGSASDSQHFAAEIVGRFARERDAWPAIALTTDTSVITAIANDYTFDNIFARQLEGIGHPGDVLIALSTSGDSENVIQAAGAARKKDIQVIALMGKCTGKLASLADIVIQAPATQTPRIQEIHAFILHCWAEMVEDSLIHRKEPL
jgi:D-sedoheptulose 7-phosphate isomerase